MAASIAASTFGIKNEIIKKSLSDFQGLEHRLEFVGKVSGVKYINDSKATIVIRCIMLLIVSHHRLFGFAEELIKAMTMMY